MSKTKNNWPIPIIMAIFIEAKYSMDYCDATFIQFNIFFCLSFFFLSFFHAN
jgi:hypothetical protein